MILPHFGKSVCEEIDWMDVMPSPKKMSSSGNIATSLLISRTLVHSSSSNSSLNEFSDLIDAFPQSHYGTKHVNIALELMIEQIKMELEIQDMYKQHMI